jgi:hypothetical protein
MLKCLERKHAAFAQTAFPRDVIMRLRRYGVTQKPMPVVAGMPRNQLKVGVNVWCARPEHAYEVS